MNVYLPNLRLPSEYQEVEYIQSTGTQYIQTSIIPSNTKGIYIKCSSQSIWDAWVYVGSSGGGNTRFWVVNSQNLMSYGWNTIHNSSGTISEDVVYEHKLNYLNSRNITLDGQVVDSNLGTLSSTNNKPIYIFAGNSNGSIYGYSYIKLYSLKISDGSNVVNDFVPCYRKSDSVIGLYDLVNNQFYTNSGTGTFSKGNDVTMKILKNAYIGEFVPFTPGSNTLAYFPLAEDGLDKMGNYTLTNTGTATTGNLGRRFTSNCLLTTTPTGVKTILAWVKPNTIPTGSTFQITITVLRCIDRNVSFLLSSGGSPASYAPCFYVYYNGADRYGGSKLMTAGNWYLVAMTTDSKVLGYINGTEYTIYNGTIGQTITDASLLKADSLSPDVVLSEVILENKVWTQAEIQDYYNLTKSNYGL